MSTTDMVTKAGSTERAQSGVKRVYYTGKTIHAVSATRTSLAELPPIGASVCFDPYGHDKGKGVDVTKPYTATLAQFAGIVVAYSASAKKDKRGYIDVCPAGDFVQALTKLAGAIPIAEASLMRLTPVNNKWYLGALAESVATGAANIYALMQFVGYTLDATDTSAVTAGALAPIRLCPFNRNP